MKQCRFALPVRPMLTPALAPSFDDPMALLRACHDKVRHFARLCLRLDEHLATHGRDAEARKAAADVLRYFDTAAPLHHEDEEHDLFPALRLLDDEALTQRIDAIEAEHATLAGMWQAVRQWLCAIIDEEAYDRPECLDAFAAAYTAHADREELEIYGAAARLPASELERLGRLMARRRGHGRH